LETLRLGATSPLKKSYCCTGLQKWGAEAAVIDLIGGVETARSSGGCLNAFGLNDSARTADKTGDEERIGVPSKKLDLQHHADARPPQAAWLRTIT